MSKQPKDNDEVDLGQLFVIIGNGFSKLFNFIASIFKGVFNFLIQILLFIKTNLLKIAIAGLIGAGLGLFLDISGNTKYESRLIVQTNFGSAKQLYNNVLYYNDLVKQKHIGLLGATFNLNEEDARSLRGFNISPIINENDILQAFDDLVQSVDTLAAKSYSYDIFKESFTKYNYKTHTILVKASKNDVFKKLDKTIITSVIENEYFKNLKKIQHESLLKTQETINKNIVQADSLHYVYKKVLLEESKKDHSGTVINLAGKQQSTKEQQLFQANRQLNKDLKLITQDLTEKSEIINVISNFQPIGHAVKEVHKKRTFQFGVLGVGLMILFLLLVKLNAFLNAYQK